MNFVTSLKNGGPVGTTGQSSLPEWRRAQWGDDSGRDWAEAPDRCPGEWRARLLDYRRRRAQSGAGKSFEVDTISSGFSRDHRQFFDCL